MFAQQQLAPDAMAMLGGDPTNAQNFLNSVTDKSRAEAYGQYAGGAEHLAAAGMPQPPDLFNVATGIQTVQGTPISTRNAEIAAAASRYGSDASVHAARIRGPEGGGKAPKLKRTGWLTGGQESYTVESSLDEAPPEIQEQIRRGAGVGATGTEAITSPDGLSPKEMAAGTSAAEAEVADKGFDIIPGNTTIVTGPDGQRYYQVATRQGPKGVSVDKLHGRQ
jgi:hypothetical protein